MALVLTLTLRVTLIVAHALTLTLRVTLILALVLTLTVPEVVLIPMTRHLPCFSSANNHLNEWRVCVCDCHLLNQSLTHLLIHLVNQSITHSLTHSHTPLKLTQIH